MHVGEESEIFSPLPFYLLVIGFQNWPSFLLFAGARCEHSIVSPLLQTNKGFQNTGEKI